MRHQTLFEAHLTHENYMKAALIAESFLRTGPFTVVTVNEGLFDHEPEARPNESLVDFRISTDENYPGFTAVDENCIMGVTTSYASMQEVLDNPKGAILVRITDKTMLVKHRAPAGHRLYWMWILEGDSRLRADDLSPSVSAGLP